MPVTSRRAKILINLQRQLETISTANGYVTNVNKVTQNLRNWHETPAAETPVIYLIDNATKPIYHAGKLMKWEWSVSLFAVMKDKSQTDMEEFISDIMECLQRNQTLHFDGERVVAHTRIENIVTDGQFFSEIEGSQLFRMDLALLYTACRTAPR